MAQKYYFEDYIQELAIDIANLVTMKQNDYGPHNILEAPYGPEAGITVRLWDKISRLKNLAEKDTVYNESIEDTYADIAGYALIALMVRHGTFNTPLRGTDGN